MLNFVRRCCVIACVALVCCSVSAQTPSPTPAPSASPGATTRQPNRPNNPANRAGAKPDQARPANAPKDAEATRAAEEADSLAGVRRGMALSLVTSLADEAQGFRDTALRARVQARAADALWETDAERARTLLRRAWDAAESADAESARKYQESLSQSRGRREPFVSSGESNVRGEVLGYAVRRERALGEEFLAKLEDQRRREAEASNFNNGATNAAASGASNNTSAQRSDFSERYMTPPPAVAQRLEVARELLNEGDAARALDFAAPALIEVSVPAIDFLTRLRDKNPQLADTRYGMMLTRALNDQSSDANAVSVLFSYLFTPHFYLIIGGAGNISTIRQDQPRPAPEVASALREAFFRTASGILLRTLSPEERERMTTAGRSGAYAIISRLLPIFERYGSDQTPAMRSQLSALAPQQTATAADQTSRPNVVGDISTVGLVPQETADRDRVQTLLERAARAAKPEDRDTFYLQAATAAERESEGRAREIAAKIQDTDTRKQLLAYIAFNALRRAVESKKSVEVERAARAEELTNEQRAWALTEAARFAVKTDRPRAVELLDEALAEARRIDAGTPQRARLLAAVATVMLEVDRARVWEMVTELVKAANAADEYTGEGGEMMSVLRTRQMVFANSQNVEGFNLTELFGALAREDFNRAMELAKTLTGEAARANAQLAIARRTLAKNK